MQPNSGQSFGPTIPGILGPTLQPTTPSAYGPYDEAIALPQAFHASTLQYADTSADSGWYMDTGATSHLSPDTSKLAHHFNKSIIPSIVVGNGATIPVTNTGHSILPSLHRPLYLQNVLVTPNITKNLIFVRKFTRDNK